MYVWPHMDESLKSTVLDQLQGSLSDKGSKGIIKEVETEIARFYDMPYCLFFSSATGAMHSLTFALNLQAGDEVIVPTYTFFASFSPLAYEGIQVVQSDCDEYGQISIAGLQRLVTPRTKGVVCTHMWEFPATSRRCAISVIATSCFWSRTARMRISDAIEASVWAGPRTLRYSAPTRKCSRPAKAVSC